MSSDAHFTELIEADKLQVHSRNSKCFAVRKMKIRFDETFIYKCGEIHDSLELFWNIIYLTEWNHLISYVTVRDKTLEIKQ